LFALLGYDVHVACYSAYLSERDSYSFVGIFDACGVREKIKYDTFLNLSRDLIKKRGDLAEMTLRLVQG
jgi:hypothetical protein